MRVKGFFGFVMLVGAFAVGSAGSAVADTVGGATAAPSTAAADTTGSGESGSQPVMAVSQTATVTLNRTQTKSVQRRVGVRADGVIGSASRTAISRYQGRKKLMRTGRPNLQTLRAMKLAFATSIEKKLTARVTGKNAGDPGLGVDATTNAVPSGAVGTAVAAARQQIGVPYRSGGTTPSGFDCSGLVMWSFADAGIDLPRTSYDQFKVGTPVARDDIQAGDLVFFSTNGSGASHVGIATSATTAISATSHGVREHDTFDSYWGAAYVGARRVA